MRGMALAISRSPARPASAAPAIPAATARSAWRQTGARVSSSWRAWRARRSASISISASEARAAIGSRPQARLTTRRSRSAPAQLKLDQRPKVSRHSWISLSASRAPSSPPDSRSRSQPNRCSASAKARLGLGRFQGSPPGPTLSTSPARAKSPANRARPRSGRPGRTSRGKTAKPSALGRAIRARCGGEPDHSVRPWRARAARAASSQSRAVSRAGAPPELAIAAGQPPLRAAMLRA